MTTVLLVADADWVVNDVRAALSDAEYSIVVATDPRAAEASWYDEEPDVAVVDLQVGSMGGFAVTRALRTAAARLDEPPTPTIVLLDRTVDTFLAGRSGADGWLLKPFSSFELRSLIDRLAVAGQPS
jgi:DNA-binding response OmpR family regulator